MTEHATFQVLRAGHVGFAVGSLNQALRFWIEGLGARLVRMGEMGGEFLGQVTGAHGAKVRMAIVSLADQTVELLEYQGLARPNAPAKPFDPGFAHLALTVNDIDAVLRPRLEGARHTAGDPGRCTGRDAGDLHRWP